MSAPTPFRFPKLAILKSAEDLRALVCDLAISGTFSVVLTPNFNQEHHDHVHVELNPRVPSVYLR